MSSTSSKLIPIRFYTQLDPYYFDVDNRPLKDIYDNLTIISDQMDLTKGSFNRGSLAAAAIGVQFTASEGFCGNLYFPGGLSLNILFGYLIQSVQFNNQNPFFRVPTLGVHDSPTNLTNLAAPRTVGKAIKYLLQGYLEEATETSQVPGVDSLTKVARFQVKASTEFDPAGAEPIIYPDGGNTAILSFVIKYGQTSLVETDITPINWVDMSNISDMVNGNSQTKLEKARFRKARHTQVLLKGSSRVTISSPDFDFTLGKDSFDVFLTGVHQTEFSVDPINRLVILGGEVGYDTEVTVLQTSIFTYKSPTS